MKALQALQVQRECALRVLDQGHGSTAIARSLVLLLLLAKNDIFNAGVISKVSVHVKAIA
jgi:hypothetical protein